MSTGTTVQPMDYFHLCLHYCCIVQLISYAVHLVSTIFILYLVPNLLAFPTLPAYRLIDDHFLCTNCRKRPRLLHSIRLRILPVSRAVPECIAAKMR